MPVVQTDGRSRDYQVFWDGYITVAMGLRPRAREARASSSAKNVHFGQTAYKRHKIIYALGSIHKSSASDSKPFQSRSKGEIPSQAWRKERLNCVKLNQAFPQVAQAYYENPEQHYPTQLINYSYDNSYRTLCQNYPISL